MTTTRTSRPISTSPAPEVHDHPFTFRGDGPVLALFTGSRADAAVAAGPPTTPPAPGTR